MGSTTESNWPHLILAVYQPNYVVLIFLSGMSQIDFLFFGSDDKCYLFGILDVKGYSLIVSLHVQS
jgi:hypothetical protein